MTPEEQLKEAKDCLKHIAESGCEGWSEDQLCPAVEDAIDDYCFPCKANEALLKMRGEAPSREFMQ